jgi:hypothetical protein
MDGAENGEIKRKPLPWVATGCLRRSMVRNAMKEGLPRSDAPRVMARRTEARCNVVRRLDLSRKRLDFHLLDGDGVTVEVGAAATDATVCTV